ncbi:TPA: 30S ribosomal protein S9 [Candidatus Woesearchaeota archaeon]|nr:30S ribosomal protein S9 [Candidatus Woesearchaeota archaeon]
MSSKPKSNVFHASGKRKRAVARATIAPGKGAVRINHVSLDHFSNEIARARIREPLVLAGDADKLDIIVRVEGGGLTSQADAVRLAIGRALVLMNPGLKSTLLDYDRQLLVADIRRKESAKPNSHGQARAKVQKSYR